ncbi:MAG: iron transporter FeoB [Planctomycetes bacterium DG_23]|nr:MAG: iron transporter FeoB [Planctomycetes bacterium DG_23]
MRRILLMGNPNVGKSAIFSRLTGADVIASNYPGTTVEFIKGYMRIGEERVEVIDIPGTYTLEPNTKAEEVAVRMLKQGDIVVNIVDATCLERNLNLTLQLLKSGKPVVINLNIWDSACHHGIKIDYQRLEQILGVPVVPTCALSGEGIKELVNRFKDAKANTFDYEEEKRWATIGEIVDQVQEVAHRHHTFLEALSDATIMPLSGIPIAILTGLVVFGLIRFIGEYLIGYIMEPAFEHFWAPLMMRFSIFLGSQGFIHDILIGQLIEGKIDFLQSFGALTTGLFVPLAMVLPYVFAFYLVLSVLEDVGYLPRVGVLIDNLMHRLGLHGLSIIPMMLGLGCNVPGALATRIMETRKERFIAATLMAIAVPCMAQIAMIMGLVGKYGVSGLAPVFVSLFLVWLILGSILKSVVKGETPEILIEMPPYRIPYYKALTKKVWIRIRQFTTEAVPFVLLGVVLINVLYTLGIIQFIGKLASPVVSGVLGLPVEATGALIIGFLRKDVAVGMLAPLGLSLKQLIVASVVLTAYFPCVATFAVLLRELGLKDMTKSALIMIATALIVGGLLNLVLGMFL